jgi:alginate O-acetyltransferase complex protein AlgI
VNVPSYEFLAFAAIVAIVVNISGSGPWRRWVFFVANIAFALTFTHSPAQLAPFAAFLALGFVSLKLVEVYKRKALFVVLVALVLLAFCALKQYTFVPHGMLLPFVYMTVGMSYVFFRIMHLVIDAYQDALPERVGIVSYISYTLNFTCLVSGPIQMYQDYRRTEFERPLPLDGPSIGLGIERIVVGLFKVGIVSPLLSYAQTQSVAGLAAAVAFPEKVLFAGLTLAVFPVYLYVNFSGYMDFVIGVARFLRLELPENFNRPFTSKGFIEFWGRWHMTLSNWLKTYVYSPLLLSLMRRFPSKKVEPVLGIFSYFVTFFLVGAWHGQTTMFLFFGVLQGLGVSLNKLYQVAMTRRLGRARYRELCNDRVYSTISRGLTFVYFSITMLWFWSTWSQLASFGAILGPVEIVCTLLVVLVVASALLAALVHVGESWSVRLAPLTQSAYFRVACTTALIVVTLSVTVLLNAPAPHIVYKGF